MHQDNSFINQAIALKEDFPNSLLSHLTYQKLTIELLKLLVPGKRKLWFGQLREDLVYLGGHEKEGESKNEKSQAVMNLGFGP